MSPKSTTSNKNTSHMPDPIKFSRALMDATQRAAPLFEKMAHSYDFEKTFDPLKIQSAYAQWMESIMNNPEKAWQMGMEFMNDWMALLGATTQKLGGGAANDIITQDKTDKRFKAEEWQENALFSFIKQSYLLTAATMEKMVRESDIEDEGKREKLSFATKLFIDALSPSNFAMTNPDVIKETIESGGENLIRGLQNLIEDMERGDGKLRISMTDYNTFEVGKNMAITPGHVVYQNDLMQLIQYEPTTKDVFKTPLLIIPPWINKYYILDLKPGKSFVEWAVSQGHTVFIISWVNPNKALSKKRFDDYMQEGILSALDHIETTTGERQTNAIGYCLGGTLLGCTLSYLQQTKQAERIKSATFLTTLLDFEHAGELKLFMDDEQLELMNRSMAESGVFDGRELNKTFCLLRSNDLIWSFVINNYLMGKEPFPFDLLYWNDDAANLPAAMHSFYLRKLYRDNLLTQSGGISMKGQPVDLSKVKTPAYFLSAREDHIAPWKATFEGTNILGGDTTFTLAASGHIAGVVNPPEKNKYCYWSTQKSADTPDEWLGHTTEHEGSWWPHWQTWVKPFGGKTTKPRTIKTPIEPAPGSYVKTVI